MHTSSGAYKLERFDAEHSVYDLSVEGRVNITEGTGMGSSQSSCTSAVLTKRLYDLTYTDGTEVVAKGSIGTLRGALG
jgi:hypothetical protein